MPFIKKHREILLITLLFFLIRLPFLDQLFLLHDERDIVLSGYSIAKTAKDLYGNFLPINFEGLNPHNPATAIYFSALWWTFLPRTVFFARLPYVIITSLLVPLIYLIVKKILQNKELATLSAFFAAFNPWIFHITRLAMDINVTLIAGLFGIYLFLNRKYIFSFCMFFIASYAYMGFRTLVPFMLLYLALYHLYTNKTRTKFLLSILYSVIFLAVLFSSFVLIDYKVTQKRINQEVIFSTNAKIDNDVIFKRNTSLASKKIKPFFHNKLTSIADYVTTSFFKSLDASYLFKAGDYSPINGNGITGQFFMFSIILFICGYLYIGSRPSVPLFYLLGFTFLGTIPALINTTSITFGIRGIFSIVGISTQLALGATYLKDALQKISSDKRIAIVSVITLFAVINMLYFGYDYFARRPILIGELFNEKERTLSTYINTKYPQGGITVYAQYQNDLFLSYFYQTQKVNTLSMVPDLQNKKVLSVGTVQFKPCLSQPANYDTVSGIIADSCLTPEQYEKYYKSARGISFLPFKDYSERIAFFDK